MIAGEGPEHERLDRLRDKLGLKEDVVLARHVPREHLPTFYAQADVVILTSHSEGIPLTLMEAMAMQRVILAPEITGIPELVINGRPDFSIRSTQWKICWRNCTPFEVVGLP